MTDSAAAAWGDNSRKHFELTNHLGNVMAVITANRVVSGTNVTPTVFDAQDYYAFGGLMPDRNTTTNTHRFGFNGKYNDNDIKGEGNQQDYGMRIYDPRIGRFLSVDPLKNKFPYWSPYAFAGNTPVQAVDLDGAEILFVNGHYQDNWLGRNAIHSDKPGKEYWGYDFESEARKFFKDYQPITDVNYINGSSAVGFDQSGKDRFLAGRLFAEKSIKKITAGFTKGKADFKLVTHSEGAAYGERVASVLIQQGWKVSKILHLSADEGDEFKANKSPFTIQFSYADDWMTANRAIEGVDEFLRVVRPDLNWKQVHGYTRSGAVFAEVQKALDGKIKAHRTEHKFVDYLIQGLKDALTVPSSITQP